MPTFWRVFIRNGCWIWSKAFSASIEMITWFLFFSLFMWCITMIDLWILKNPCIRGINPTWSWCMMFLMYMCMQFANIFVEGFCIYVDEWYWPVIFFFCVIFFWFWYQSNSGFIEWALECDFLSNFLEVSEEEVLTLFWMFGRIQLWSHEVLDFYFLEMFNHIFNLGTCDWSIQIFCFFLVQSW